MVERTPLLVAAYPKSGSTWLTRLLGNALDSPTGGSIASEDANEVATEGQDRPGPYIVRKGHYRLINDVPGPAIPAPHRLAWKCLDGEKVIFLTRDPRDVCVSGAHYWRQPPEQFLNRMVSGDVAKLPAWHIYVDQWLAKRNYFPLALISYEALLYDAEYSLRSLMDRLKLEYDPARLPGVVMRQSFDARKNDYDGPHPDQHAAIMRRGVAGGWMEYFNQRMGRMCQAHFGATMARLGYVTDAGWWRELPE